MIGLLGSSWHNFILIGYSFSVLRQVHFVSVEQVCIVYGWEENYVQISGYDWGGGIFLCDLFEDVDTHCTLTAMCLGSGVMV
jgi:hypothetical protein